MRWRWHAHLPARSARRGTAVVALDRPIVTCDLLCAAALAPSRYDMASSLVINPWNCAPDTPVTRALPTKHPCLFVHGHPISAGRVCLSTQYQQGVRVSKGRVKVRHAFCTARSDMMSGMRLQARNCARTARARESCAQMLQETLTNPAVSVIAQLHMKSYTCALEPRSVDRARNDENGESRAAGG